MNDACVTLEEVLAAATVRSASLVPETSGYLTLAVSDTTSRLPLALDDRSVLLTTEGSVALARRGDVVPAPESARRLRDLLRRLLAVSAGTMPGLAAAAKSRAESDRGVDALAEELEAALIPVNRTAARRALARLARETLRARESGKLRRALRAPAQPAPAPAPAPSSAAETPSDTAETLALHVVALHPPTPAPPSADPDAIEVFLGQFSPEPPPARIDPTPTEVGTAWAEVDEMPTVLDVMTALEPPRAATAPAPDPFPPLPLVPIPLETAAPEPEETPLTRETLPWPIGLGMAPEGDAGASPAASDAPLEGLALIDAILRSASQQGKPSRPGAAASGPPTRADELIARFIAHHESDAARRAAARSMKLLAGLEPTPSARINALPPGEDETRPPDSSRRPEVHEMVEDPPLPGRHLAVPPRPRRGPALWIALLALALLTAGVALSLRPDLLASLAGLFPHMRGALTIDAGAR
jgi:hypothetical protein